jgi:SAM-dependent methyltransferase
MVLNGNDVVAVDPLLPSYEKMGLLAPSSFENVRFEAANIEELEHMARFDVVFCINAINHVQDLNKSLHTLSQAAKPSATLVITTDCHRFHFYRLLFRLIPLDILHPHQFSELEYIAAIEKHQIRVVRKVQLKHNHFFKYMAFVCEKI